MILEEVKQAVLKSNCCFVSYKKKQHATLDDFNIQMIFNSSSVVETLTINELKRKVVTN